MAIVFTGLTSGSDPTNNPSTTASISPTSGAQVFVAFASAVVGGDAANAADTFSVSGCNLTWVEVDRQIYGTRRTILVFRGYGTPSSGTLSLEQTYAATGTWTENMWSVVEVTGADETTPIGTSYSNSATYAGQPLTITVSETPDAGDMVFAAFGIGDAAASGTINSELSNEIHDQGGGEDVRTVLTAYDSSPDSTPVPGITWTGSNDAGGIAFIVNAAAGGSNTDYSPGVGSAVISGLGPLVNPQFASPSADATDGNWTPSTGGDLYACIDETLRSDTDYIQSGTNPSSDSCTVKLATITDPGTDDGFHLQYAAGAVGATGQVVVSLRQGNSPGTEIAAWTHTNLPVGSYAEFDDAVTSAQAGNITDYSDLYLRIVAS